jgi:hypothetical protein
MESRDYSEITINASIERARAIPRHVVLRRANRKQEDRRPVFALTFGKNLNPAFGVVFF